MRSTPMHHIIYVRYIIGNEVSNISYFQEDIRIFIVISDMAMQMFFDGYYVKKK